MSRVVPFFLHLRHKGSKGLCTNAWVQECTALRRYCSPQWIHDLSNTAYFTFHFKTFYRSHRGRILVHRPCGGNFFFLPRPLLIRLMYIPFSSCVDLIVFSARQSLKEFEKTHRATRKRAAGIAKNAFFNLARCRFDQDGQA